MNLEKLETEAKKIIAYGLPVELCGSWLWVHDNPTDDQAATMRKDGWKYSGKKNAWFFAGSPCKSRRFIPMDKIRQLHGSIQLKEEETCKA